MNGGVSGGGGLAEGFPDLSGLPAARRLHPGRWLAAGADPARAGALGRAFAEGQIEWAYVGRFLTVPAILEGIRNTVVMAVLAMALGIVLGVAVAVMRLSPEPGAGVGGGRLHLAVPRHCR